MIFKWKTKHFKNDIWFDNDLKINVYFTLGGGKLKKN